MALSADLVVSVDESHDGASVKVARGGTVLVRLPAQLGTGFSWQPAASSLLLPVKSEVARSRHARPGSTEDQVFIYSASDTGTEKLTFDYRRPWEKDVLPARRFAVSVTVTAE